MNKSLEYIVLGFLLLVGACKPEYTYNPDSASLMFATDTLSFDTIFTGESTPTTHLALYNKSDEDLVIDRIWLSGGDNSSYNVNINGTNATSVEQVRLPKRDSLWIFVNICPMETADVEPYVVEDVVNVTSGSHTISSRLIAYAQNVNRLNESHVGGQTWSSQRPYLLSGTNIVDSTQTLTISEGTKVYFEEGASLQVYGNIVVTGSVRRRVIFKGVRNDEFYDDIPGQWSSITFMPGSKNNYISYSDIACAKYGIQADSASSVDIENVVIRDASYGAILAYGADVSIYNSILYNCGGALVAAYGGNTKLVHCTLSNYYAWEVRRKPALWAVSADNYPPLQGLSVLNSIVVGNQTDEIDISTLPDEGVLFSHSYLKLSTEDEDNRFKAVKIGATPGFVNRDENDYHLTDKSECINLAYPSYSEEVPFDFDGKSRFSDFCPDMGALEFMPKTNEQ